MHLTTLALLQVLELPKNAMILNITRGEFSPDYWKCHDVSGFSRIDFQKKCPKIMPDMNVCCASWNDCLSMNNSKGKCTEQLYECSKAVLSASSASDFEQCSSFPTAVWNHYNDVSAGSVMEMTSSLHMKSDVIVSELYRMCPSKRNTISSCFYNFQTHRYFSDAIRSLLKINDVMKQFDLRVCLEMHLVPEDGEHCKQSVESALKQLNERTDYQTVITKMDNSSVWQCGSNQFETYLTQVLVGQKCVWLREAFNTCCKYAKSCSQEEGNRDKCNKGWDSCNNAVITNGDGTTAQECTPFASWVKNAQVLDGQTVERSLSTNTTNVFVWAVVGAVVFLVLLAAYFVITFCRDKKQQNYRQYVERTEKEYIANEEQTP